MTLKTQNCLKCYKASPPNQNINKPSTNESPNHQEGILSNVNTTAINVNQSTINTDLTLTLPIMERTPLNPSFMAQEMLVLLSLQHIVIISNLIMKQFLSQTPSPSPTHSRLSLSHAPTPSLINVNSIYKKTQTCDASVGITPIKSAEPVLLKFFPYLMEKPALLVLLSDQVETHRCTRPTLWKRSDNLALTLWTRSPKSYDEFRKSGLLLPSPKSFIII